MAGGEQTRNALPKGYEIEGYRIERVLGSGGFGVTYLATEISINRKVAIKEYLPSGIAVRGKDDVSVHPLSGGDRGDFDWGLERFKKEAETLVTFHHPNIVTVFRFFQGNGTAYLVMAYVDGESLAQILERAGTLSEPELREILTPLLAGLEHVHNAGFLHRDIKPGNIYIRRDGSPVLLDFGAARLAMGGRSQSLTSIVSAGYAPFEQYTTRGNQGPWSDIYALGGVLYRAATGNRPPDAPDRIRDDPYVSAVEAAKDKFEPAFLGAIDAALRMDEDDRPQTVGAWRPMFDGAAPAATPGAEATLATGQRAPPVETDTRWPERKGAPARPQAVPLAARESLFRGSLQPTAAGAKPGGSAAKWVIIGLVAFVLVGGVAAGVVILLDNQKKAEAVQRMQTEARAALNQADAAMQRGDLAEAERRIAEAETLAPDLPEIKASQARLEAEKKKRAVQTAVQQVRQLLDQAREAIRRRQFEAAERALVEAARLANQHGLAEFRAEIERVRNELAAAARERPPERTPDPPPATGATWPTDPEMRRAVEETIRKISPSGN